MIASMAAYEAYLLPSTEWEYRKFAADSYESDFAHRTGGRSFAEEVEQLRLFLEKRAAWMDEQLAKRDPDVEGFGMKVTEEIRLTLSGDTVRADSSGFDYRAESGSVFLQIRAPWTDIEVYLNGKAVTAQSETSGQTWLVTADPAAFDKGCNVWTVYAYENGEVAGVNYLSLVLEGEKREAPEKGSALPPDAAEAEPSVYELSSASLDAFVQIAKGGEYDALRLVFVADQAYLYAYESLLVHAVFTTVSGEKRCLEGRLAAADGDYALYRTVTADGALYRAASGDLLFGNVIREIPHGLLASLSVTVSDTEGHILYSASEKVS